jgi:hypothetical protein
MSFKKIGTPKEHIKKFGKNQKIGGMLKFKTSTGLKKHKKY